MFYNKKFYTYLNIGIISLCLSISIFSSLCIKKAPNYKKKILINTNKITKNDFSNLSKCSISAYFKHQKQEFFTTITNYYEKNNQIYSAINKEKLKKHLGPLIFEAIHFAQSHIQDTTKIIGEAYFNIISNESTLEIVAIWKNNPNFTKYQYYDYFKVQLPNMN